MANEDLFKRLSALGFQLFGTEEEQNANLTLADMVKSRNLRLWEGFPVVLANSVEKGLFNYDKVKRYLETSFDENYLSSLMVLSLALYKVLNLKLPWTNEFYKSLTKAEKEKFSECLEKFKNNDDLQVVDYAMSSQRLKSTFNNYFKEEQSKLSDLLSMKDEFGLEYSLSQVFSPKQKELFLKKLRREKLTKTEREYFSRTVKKKVLALANTELHRLAQNY